MAALAVRNKFHQLRLSSKSLPSTHHRSSICLYTLKKLYNWKPMFRVRYSTCSKRLILKANEKARHSTDDHPKRIALNVNMPQFLQSRSSFRRKAEELSSLLPPDIQHTDKTSFIFLLHHGSKAPLIPDESPPLSQVLPVELIKTT